MMQSFCIRTLNEGSDQNARMHRLIRIFVALTCPNVVFVALRLTCYDGDQGNVLLF